MIFNASGTPVASGSVVVDAQGKTEISVFEGRMVFSTADGMKTVDAAQKIVLAMMPGNTIDTSSILNSLTGTHLAIAGAVILAIAAIANNSGGDGGDGGGDGDGGIGGDGGTGGDGGNGGGGGDGDGGGGGDKPPGQPLPPIMDEPAPPASPMDGGDYNGDFPPRPQY